jgi:hypothetical protein
VTGLFGFDVPLEQRVFHLYRLGTASGHLRKLQFLHWIRSRDKGRETIFKHMRCRNVSVHQYTNNIPDVKTTPNPMGIEDLSPGEWAGAWS